MATKMLNTYCSCITPDMDSLLEEQLMPVFCPVTVETTNYILTTLIIRLSARSETFQLTMPKIRMYSISLIAANLFKTENQYKMMDWLGR